MDILPLNKVCCVWCSRTYITKWKEGMLEPADIRRNLVWTQYNEKQKKETMQFIYELTRRNCNSTFRGLLLITKIFVHPRYDKIAKPTYCFRKVINPRLLVINPNLLSCLDKLQSILNAITKKLMNWLVGFQVCKV